MKVKLPLDKKALDAMTMQGVLDVMGAVNSEFGLFSENSERENIGLTEYLKQSKLYNAALDILHEEINRRSAGVKRSHDLVLMAEKSAAVVQ